MKLSKYLENKSVKSKVVELLDTKANQFIISLTSMVSQDDMLKNCEPKTLVRAALTAMAMDLPLNPNFGFIYIIPFKNKDKGITEAQLQFGYKAFIQLAMRSGQFKTISASAIYEGQVVEKDPLKGYRFNFNKKDSEKVIGYAGYFELLNGFSKVLYMTTDQLKRHGLKYSQSYKRGYGLWKDNFDAMASKTVLKLLLSRYAPLTIDMQKILTTDQAVIKDWEGREVEYIDNKPLSLDAVQREKEIDRVEKWIETAKTLKKLKEVWEYVEGLEDGHEIKVLYLEKERELSLSK